MSRSGRTACVVVVAALLSACTSNPAVHHGAQPQPSLFPTTAQTSASPQPSPLRTAAARPTPRESASAVPQVRTTTARPVALRTTQSASSGSPRPPAPPPPPPTQPVYQPPTVAATHFVSCHSSSASGDGPVFLANVELLGGQSWRPAQADVTHLSGSWWRGTYEIVGANYSNPDHFAWSAITLFGPDNKVHTLAFPSQLVIHATCPS